MEWHLIRSMDSVHMGILTAQEYNRSGPPRPVIDLYPSFIGKDIPVGENPSMARTFLNQFVKDHKNYLATDFRTPGWAHSMKKQWWSLLTDYILDQFSGELERLGLYEAIRATCYGMEVSMPNFYAILELYCPSTETFFCNGPRF